MAYHLEGVGVVVAGPQVLRHSLRHLLQVLRPEQHVRRLWGYVLYQREVLDRQLLRPRGLPHQDLLLEEDQRRRVAEAVHLQGLVAIPSYAQQPASREEYVGFSVSVTFSKAKRCSALMDCL